MYKFLMSITKISDQALHIQTKQSVKEEKLSTLKVLMFLEEVHRRKLFIDHGHSTLMKYMTSELGYSDAESWTRIQAMKLIVEVPEVKEKIENGEMSLSNAAVIKEALRQNDKPVENGFELDGIISKPTKKEIIEKALDNSQLPTRKLKGLLNPSVIEKRIILSERLIKKMEKLLGSMSEVELIESLLDEKLKDIELNKSSRTSEKPSTNSRYIPKHIERATFERAQHQCEAVDKKGKRCEERRNLQIDHIKPYAVGGDNSEQNLRLLCSGHNQRRSFKTFSNRQPQARSGFR
jgi:5-methylcytosine-specific restriction endonuclease McrA